MGPALHPDVTRSFASGHGAPLQVRNLSSHAATLHEHLARLDEADRCLRLGRMVAVDAIAAFCTRGHCAEPINLGGYLHDRLIASAELAILPEDRFGLSSRAAKADLLVAVERDYRGRGYAQRLVATMLQHAAMRQIALVRLTYGHENAAMAQVTSRLGAVHSRTPHRVRAELCTGWIGQIEAVIPIPRNDRFRPITLR